MKPGETPDILKKGHKLDPGEYEVIVVPPKKVEGEIPFRLTFVPKIAGVEADAPEERPIDKALRERAERLQRWAAEDSSRPAISKSPYKMTFALV